MAFCADELPLVNEFADVVLALAAELVDRIDAKPHGETYKEKYVAKLMESERDAFLHRRRCSAHWLADTGSLALCADL
eukprot:56700-Karenia_brevis.AAC.1